MAINIIKTTLSPEEAKKILKTALLSDRVTNTLPYTAPPETGRGNIIGQAFEQNANIGETQGNNFGYVGATNNCLNAVPEKSTWKSTSEGDAFKGASERIKTAVVAVVSSKPVKPPKPTASQTSIDDVKSKKIAPILNKYSPPTVATPAADVARIGVAPSVDQALASPQKLISPLAKVSSADFSSANTISTQETAGTYDPRATNFNFSLKGINETPGSGEDNGERAQAGTNFERNQERNILGHAFNALKIIQPQDLLNDANQAAIGAASVAG